MRILLILCLSFLFSATSNFNVEGMMCATNCVNKAQNAVESLDGIKSCKINFDKSTMVVEYDEKKVDDKLIIKTLNENTTFSCSLEKDEEPKKGFFKRIFGWF